MVSARFLVSVVRCPYCKAALGTDDELVACAACGARHHADCHKELGRCATCGSWNALYSRTALGSGRAQLALDRERLEDSLGRARRHTRMVIYALLLIVPTAILITWEAAIDRSSWMPPFRGRIITTITPEELAQERAARRLDDRERMREEIARARADAHALAQDGWQTAELIAQANPSAQDPLPYLREALRRAPNDQVSLRTALVDWISVEERIAAHSR